MLAIADPKDRELVRLSVGESFDANVKILKAVVPRPQSTGPSDTYIVRWVWGCASFARRRPGFPLPLIWDPPAVDEEGNTFMGEQYCPQVALATFLAMC